MGEIIQEEFSYFAKMLEETNGNPVETQDIFNVPILNGLWRILTGQRLDSNDPNLTEIMRIMDELFAQSGSALGMLAFINSKAFLLLERLGLLDMLNGIKKIFQIIDVEIAEHESTFQDDSMRDFTDCYIDQKILNEADVIDQKFAKENLRSIYFDMFLAGSETTSSTLKWALLFMVLYPEIQEKVLVINNNIQSKTLSMSYIKRYSSSSYFNVSLIILNTCSEQFSKYDIKIPQAILQAKRAPFPPKIPFSSFCCLNHN